MSILTSQVLSNISKRIKLHHELYEIKVSASLWEETLHRAFLDVGFLSVWNKNGHQVGADVVVDGFRISCKSGEITGKKQQRLVISSHRTTRFKTLKEKIAFLSEQHEDEIFSLVNERDKYTIYTFNKPDVSQLDWVETGSGWSASDVYGSQFSITRSMSDQFWMKISTSYPMNKFEV